MRIIFLAAMCFACLVAKPRVVPAAWQANDQRFEVTSWAGGLNAATQLRIAPDGSVWVLEQRGRLLRLVETDRGIKPFLVTDLRDEAYSADLEVGATSFVFSQYASAESCVLYIAHNWDDPKLGRVGAISRVRVSRGNVATRDRVFGPVSAAGAHQVDRLLIDGNQDLLLSVGDIWNPPLSQADDQVHGKVLRFHSHDLNTKDTAVAYEMEAKGLRSPFGLARRSDGLIVIGENGPDTDDKLCILKRGANYGWGLEHDQLSLAAASGRIAGPLFRWPRTVSPDSLCFCENGPSEHTWPKEFVGNLFVALFNTTHGEEGRADWEKPRQVLRFELCKDQVTGSDKISIQKVSAFLINEGNTVECPLDMAFSPSGDLFLLTYSLNHGALGTSKIYRIRFKAN